MTKLRLWFFVLKHFWKTEIIVHGTSYQRETCTRFFRILSRTRKSGVVCVRLPERGAKSLVDGGRPVPRSCFRVVRPGHVLRSPSRLGLCPALRWLGQGQCAVQGAWRGAPRQAGERRRPGSSRLAGSSPRPPPSVPGCLRLLRNRTNETTNPWPHPRKRHTDIPSLLTFLGPSQTSVHRWAEGRDRVLTSWGRGVSGAGFCLRCRLWLLPGARNLAGLSPDPIPHCSEFRSPAPNSELAAGPPCCPDGLEELDKAAVL